MKDRLYPVQKETLIKSDRPVIHILYKDRCEEVCSLEQPPCNVPNTAQLFANPPNTLRQ